MALNVDQIIPIVWPAVAREMNSRYAITTVMPLDVTSSFVVHMYDPESNAEVPIIWSRRENEDRSKADRIRLVRNLLVNGVQALDALTKASDDVEDVIFD